MLKLSGCIMGVHRNVYGFCPIVLNIFECTKTVYGAFFYASPLTSVIPLISLQFEIFSKNKNVFPLSDV